MPRSIISEGKTTNEAIEKGLKELKVSKSMVDIKVLENEEKRSFFSILAPRVVKVELTVKENVTGSNKKEVKKEKTKVINREIVLTEEEQEIVFKNVDGFMKIFMKYLPEETKYEIVKTTAGVNVNLSNADLAYLIGYRGETLYSIQNILNAIAGKGVPGKTRVILDIEGYKSKREKTLEELAEKIAKTVIKTRKPVALEPMGAYERKIIHSKLQDHPKVETKSIGEEPRRRVVVSLKK